MKIALVLAQPPSYSETFFNNKIKGLQQKGHEVILFTGPSRVKYKNCLHKESPPISKFFLLQFFSICIVFIRLLPYFKVVNRFFKLEKLDGSSTKVILKKIYLNAHLLTFKGDWVHFGFGTLALERELIPKSIGASMAVSFRGFDIGIYPLKHPNCYQKLWKHVSRIHVISNDIKQLLYANGFNDQASVIKITPAIDNQYFNADRFNDFSTPIQLLTVARLHWKKGLVKTLEALALLKKRGIKFQYTLVGEGDEKEHLMYVVNQLNLQEDVTFSGKLASKDVKTIMQTANIYIQYSVQEGFCNAVLEAQSMGLLCVVSDAEGLSENVKDNFSGWVVARGQSKLLADKLLEVVSLSSEERLRISENAVNRVKDHFNLNIQQQAFHDFYTKKQE